MPNPRPIFAGAVAGQLRGGRMLPALMARFGALLIAIAGIGLAVKATARIPRPAPVVVTHTVSLPEFGMQITLPSTWKLEPGQKGTDVVATHTDTGAILAAAITLSAPPAPKLDAMIDGFIEDQRARLGAVENISRGAMAVGLLDAGWVKLSFPRQGEPVRMKTVIVQRGLRALTLICTGGAPAQKACDAAIRPVSMAR